MVSSTQAYEELAVRGNATHLEFSPDRQALVGWVDSARFVAATSSQVDPACFIRGSTDHGEYLWDYDLPSSTGADSGAAGYYLIARPGAAMREAVSRSLAQVSDPPPLADPFLREISKRGIPVLKRLASGGRSAKGEVGMLLAVRLLQDAFREEAAKVRLPVVTGNCIHMLLSVDSYQAPLTSARKAIGGNEPMKRPDLLVFAISLGERGAKIKVTPLEVKFYTTPQNRELTEAVAQANSLYKLLKSLWADEPINAAWDASGRALLARCLDECFRIYADRALHHLEPKAWAQIHEEVLHSILGSPEMSKVVSINSGRLLAFGPAFEKTKLVSMDGDTLLESLVVDASDCRALVTGEGDFSSALDDGVAQLLLSHPDCDKGPMTITKQSFTAGAAETEAVRAVEDSVPAEGRGSVSVEDGEAATKASTELALAVDGAESEIEPGPAEEDLDSIDDEEPAALGGTVPIEIRERVTEAFAGFIGNERPVRRVGKDLLIALMKEPPSLPKSYLLEGLPSVGKTEMARRIAAALGLPFVKLDGPGLTTREKLFDLIDGQLGEVRFPRQVGEDAGQPVFRYPPFVVLIDEIHLVSGKVQESLLTMLEASDRSVRLNDRVAELPKATFIFATTQDGKLDKAFKSRCTEIYLRPYSVAEVAEMVEDHVRRAGIDPHGWDADAYPKIARLGRLIPRRAFEVANELMDELQTTDNPGLPLHSQLEIVRDMMEVDANGLGPLDLEYLDVLDRADRPLGEDAVATMIGTVDRDKIVEEVEPLLRRLNLIILGARGREITAAGREYIASHRLNT